MPVLVPTPRHAAAVLMLASASAFATQLTGVVQEASGKPVAGALVVASSETDVKDGNGASHRWIATSDAGRFAFDGFPAGACHVTANAGAGRIGVATAPCTMHAGDATLTTAIVVAAQAEHASGQAAACAPGSGIRGRRGAAGPRAHGRRRRDGDPGRAHRARRLGAGPAGGHLDGQGRHVHGRVRLAQFVVPGQKAPIELKSRRRLGAGIPNWRANCTPWSS